MDAKITYKNNPDMSGNTKEPSSGGRASVPSQSYMWFNGTGPCELGQYCGGIYKLLCVCVCVCVCVRVAVQEETD